MFFFQQFFFRVFFSEVFFVRIFLQDFILFYFSYNSATYCFYCYLKSNKMNYLKCYKVINRLTKLHICNSIYYSAIVHMCIEYFETMVMNWKFPFEIYNVNKRPSGCIIIIKYSLKYRCGLKHFIQEEKKIKNKSMGKSRVKCTPNKNISWILN